MNLNSLLCFYVVIVVIFGFEPLGGLGLWPGNASMKQHTDAGWCGTAIASQQPQQLSPLSSLHAGRTPDSGR